MDTQNMKENLKNSIDHAFAEMNELKNKAAESTSDLRKNIQSDMQSLESKKQELESRMADLRNAAENKREELSKAVEESAASFRKGLKRVADVFDNEAVMSK